MPYCVLSLLAPSLAVDCYPHSAFIITTAIMPTASDDIMEPYRPYIDELVIQIMAEETDIYDLTHDMKVKFLQIPTLDVTINGKRSPLMIAATITTASVYKCFNGEIKQIIYPTI